MWVERRQENGGLLELAGSSENARRVQRAVKMGKGRGPYLHGLGGSVLMKMGEGVAGEWRSP